MRRYIIVLLSFWVTHAIGQTISQNFIMTETMLDSAGSRSIRTVQYYDGFGRPSLRAEGGHNAEGKYLYTQRVYDDCGRDSVSYLPVVGTTSPTYQTAAEIQALAQQTYYDSHAYSQTTYDALDRPLFISTPGDNWNGRGRTIRHVTNGNGEVRKYEARIITASSQGFYPEGTLTGEVAIDEDSVCVTTFRDLTGRTVLERRGEDDDTYFVYADNGLLRFILSPGYQESESATFRYRYDYDSRGRMIRKYLPSCNVISYWYDTDNRLVLMKDPRLQIQSKSRFFLYDRLGRLAVQGTCASKNANCSYPVYANRLPSANFHEICGTGYYVTNRFTLNNPQIEIVNYYDDYDFLTNNLCSGLSADNDYTRCNPACACSLPTGRVTAASDGTLMLAVYYYDEEGRVIDSREGLLCVDFLHRTTDYSFTGKPTAVHHLIDTSSHDFTIDEFFSYDTLTDQPIRHDLNYNNDTIVRVASYTYDPLGRLSSMLQHDSHISTSYSYDLHGWPTSINAAKSYGTYDTLFCQQIYYADGCGTPCYNGNISSMKWKTGTGGHGYRYGYDRRNRLVVASHCLYDMSLSYDDYSEAMTYNRNSAITSLIRTGNSLAGHGNMDVLSYSYNGNRLTSITDMGSSNVYDGAFEFVNGSNTNQEYTYNTAGDLTRDRNKGIARIDYDLFGHPRRIQFTNGNVTEYVYAADGEKLRAKQTTAVEGLTVALGQTHELTEDETMDVDSTDYFGKMQIRKSHVGRVLKASSVCYHFGNGYLSVDATPYRPRPGAVIGVMYVPSFHYYLRDHLGSNRMVVSDTGDIEQTNEYYPYGGPWGNASTFQGLQPFKYNGKELDRVHGLDWYDYGARRYDPAFAQFTQIDPLCEKYPHLSPYAYCAGNPVNAIDPDGKLVIFINGFHKGDEGATARYWNGFDTAVMNHFNDYKYLYRDGSLGGVKNNLLNITRASFSNLNPFIRGLKGFIQGALDAEKIFNNLSREENGEIKESIRLVSHSMGGAYAKGYAQALVNYIAQHPMSTSGASITEYDFAPFQPSFQLAVQGVDTYQYSHLLDPVAKYTPVWGATMMPTETSWRQGHSINSFFEYISTLPEGRYKYDKGELIKK